MTLVSDPVRLPLRLTTEADESLVGFLVRLAERNCFDSPRWLMEIAGIRFATVDVAATKPFDLALLSRASKVGASTLRRMAYWPDEQGGKIRFLDHRIGREMVTLQSRRACPRCLELSTHHRAAWDLSIVSVCPHHAVRLVRRCSNCGRPLNWRLASLTRCQCGADFRQSHVEPIARDELDGARQVYRVLGLIDAEADQSAPEALRGLSADEVLTLLLYLGWFATGARLYPHPIKLCSEGVDSHRLLKTGYRACQEWPDGFFQYLDDLRRRSSARPGRYGFAKEFGPLGEWLLDPCLPSSLKALVAPAFRSYLERSPSLRFRSRRAPKLEGRHSTLTLTKAASLLNRSIVRVHCVLRARGLIAARYGLGSGAPVVVEKDVVARLREEMDDLIGKDGLCRVLGCSKKMAAALVKDGLFTHASSPAAELFGRAAWRSSEVKEFLADLERYASPQARPEDLVPLTEALRILRSRGVTAETAIAAIRSGGFESIALDPAASGLARLAVDRSSCLRLGRRPREPFLMSIPEGAEELGLKQQVAYALCNRGLIRTIRRRGQRGRRITADELKRFSESYVFASSLDGDGHRRGWASQRLIASGAVPVSGPAVDGCRQYLFRRIDVEKVGPFA